MKNKLFAILSLSVLFLVAFEKRQMFSEIENPALLLQQADVALMLVLFLASVYLFFVKEGKVDSTQEQAEGSSAEVAEASSDAAVLYVLSMLQEKGRLLDFVMDDVAPYSDEQVGQVARVVHSGVKEALSRIVEIDNLHSGEEGETISIEQDFASEKYRLSGKLNETPPFSGRVLHRGWQANNISLPVSSKQTNVVHPVEVEVL